METTVHIGEADKPNSDGSTPQRHGRRPTRGVCGTDATSDEGGGRLADGRRYSSLHSVAALHGPDGASPGTHARIVHPVPPEAASQVPLSEGTALATARRSRIPPGAASRTISAEREPTSARSHHIAYIAGGRRQRRPQTLPPGGRKWSSKHVARGALRSFRSTGVASTSFPRPTTGVDSVA